MLYAIYMNKPETARFPVDRVLGCSAGICWLAAWFLPVIEDSAGWAAFRAAIMGPFRDPFPVGGEEAVPQVLSALTNVVFAVLFALWVRARVTRPTLFLKVALACLLINLYWLVQMLRAGETTGLLIGYYVWLAAFALLVVVAALNVASARRTSRTPTAGTPA
jgi:hypothetical protein